MEYIDIFSFPITIIISIIITRQRVIFKKFLKSRHKSIFCLCVYDLVTR